jgi:biopolymer transport protein ExbD
MTRARSIGRLSVLIMLASGPSVAPAQDVKTPGQPKPLDRPEAALTLTLNAKGELLVPGKAPLADVKAIGEYLRREAAALEGKGGAGRAHVVLRADREARYRDVVRVLDLCREAGFTDISLRVAKTGEGK